jgi:transcriptional regulator with XRE-family HTH domain
MAGEGDWFGGRLKELREGQGLTQQRLGELAGIFANTIARLERAERKPSWDTVVALAKALDVPTDAFLQPPAEREPAKPGRPPKAKEEVADSPMEAENRPHTGDEKTGQGTVRRKKKTGSGGPQEGGG